MFFTLIFGDNFFFFNLENCVRNESCRDNIVPISQTGPKLVAQTDVCVHR